MAIVNILQQQITNGTSYAFNTTSTSFTQNVGLATGVSDYCIVVAANVSATATAAANGVPMVELFSTKHTSDPDNPIIRCWGVANPFSVGSSTPNITIGGGGWGSGNGNFHAWAFSGVDTAGAPHFGPDTGSNFTSYTHNFATDQISTNNQVGLTICSVANQGVNNNTISFSGGNWGNYSQVTSVGAFTPTGGTFPESGNPWDMRFYWNIGGSFIGALTQDEGIGDFDPFSQTFVANTGVENQSTSIVLYGPVSAGGVDNQLLLGVS